MERLPSVGDILALSRLTWRIGSSFSINGHTSIPLVFSEVQSDVNALSHSLKLLAETIFGEGDASFLAAADPSTFSGLHNLLEVCQRTVENLEAFVDQYQVTRKTQTRDGYSIERVWTEHVLRDPAPMIWTAEGGDLGALQDLLNIHNNSLSITRQAFQSKWLLGLERTISLMYPKIEALYFDSSAAFTERISDATRVITAIAEETPWIRPTDDSKRPSTLDLNDFSREPSISDRIPLDRITRTLYQLSSTSSVSSLRYPHPPSEIGSSISSISNFDYQSRSSTYPTPLTDATSHYPSSYGNTPTVIDTPVMDFRQMASAVASDTLLPPLPPPQIPIDDPLELSMSSLSISSRIDTQDVITPSSPTSSVVQDSFEKDAFRNSAILCDSVGMQVEYTLVADPAENPYGIEVVQAMADCRICVVRKRESTVRNKSRLSTSIWAFSKDGSIRMQQQLEEGEGYIPYTSYFSPEKISVTIPTELLFHPKKYGGAPVKRAHTSWVNYVFRYKAGASLFQTELMGLNLVTTFKTTRTLRVHEGVTGRLSYQEQLCGMENMRIWEDEPGSSSSRSSVTGGVIAMIHFSAHFRNGYLAFYLNSLEEPIRVKDDGGREVKIKGLKIPVDEKGKGISLGSATARGGAGAGSQLRRGDTATTITTMTTSSPTTTTNALPTTITTTGGGMDRSRKGSISSSSSSSTEAKRWITGVKIEFAHEAEKQVFLKLVRDVQSKTRR